ncbi:helix-turn-helix transcriptional regulator [Nocardia tengchongensis]|uniref:helix-turn-helix transcriptional regulator n=1 Tax=Nocardia tengchongensis TaxID=2055889 RepID=UPI003607047E
MDSLFADRQALGKALAQLRAAAGVNQAAIATRYGVDRSYVSHAECGRLLPPRPFWQLADSLVGADGALLAAFDVHVRGVAGVGPATIGSGAAAILPAAPAVDLHSMLDPTLTEWLTMNRRELLEFLAAAGTLPAATLLAGLEAGTRGQLSHASGMKVDAAKIEQIETLVDTLGRQYEAFGPRAVLAIRQGQADLVDALLRDCPAALLPRLLSLRAHLARALGWMAYDAGDLHLAGHHYGTARDCAEQAADADLSALVLCNMSLAATRAGRPGRGIDHASAAAHWATRSGDRYLLAYTFDMAAEAHAELGQNSECRSALDRSAALVASATDTRLPTYVYDPALSAGFAAECLTKLGAGGPAVAAAQRCCELIDPAYSLSQGFADVGHALALALTGDIDHAAAIIGHTADTATAYGSARLTAEVRNAHTQLHHLAPDAAAVRALGHQLAAAHLV